MLAVLSLTFASMHDYANANDDHPYSISAANMNSDIAAKSSDVEQGESKDELHKHCTVSCFVIPTSYVVTRISMKKDITTYDNGYLELALTNRLKRPPRKSV